MRCGLERTAKVSMKCASIVTDMFKSKSGGAAGKG